MFIIKWDRIIWYEKIQLYEPLESGSWKHFDISTKNRKLMPIEIITVDYKYNILDSWSSESQSLSLFEKSGWHLTISDKMEDFCQIIYNNLNYFLENLTLRRPKQHRAQAPDVPDLAQTVKPWSDLFKIFRNVFAGA